MVASINRLRTVLLNPITFFVNGNTSYHIYRHVICFLLGKIKESSLINCHIPRHFLSVYFLTHLWDTCLGRWRPDQRWNSAWDRKWVESLDQAGLINTINDTKQQIDSIWRRFAHDLQHDRFRERLKNDFHAFCFQLYILKLIWHRESKQAFRKLPRQNLLNMSLMSACDKTC